ncbi:hypothetical protein NXS98_00890 [Fontisphaera persica]|uniref:hypothetical protein n=1 Tax=Fontisphaera persica TaxID=2974023 RepID=UPI0024C09EA8|nr:hypothetical protein [Fontisphaera persica]WCJ59705.1 hypothetical protein NXS98_00890 [Fontisphaera persica]
MVVLQEGAFLAEGHWRVWNVINSIEYNKLVYYKPPKILGGDWFCLMGHWQQNYHHWLWDEIPKIYTSLKYLPNGVRFIASKSLSSVQLETLRCLEIKEENIYYQSYDEQCRVEKLWFATPLGHSESAQPHLGLQIF